MQLNSKAQKKWKTLVDKWQSSGLTQKEFCQLNDISLRAFQNNVIPGTLTFKLAI